MTDSREQERLPCFGDLGKVFPAGKEGLREVPPGCWPCGQRVECLKAAISSPDARRAMHEEAALREEKMTGGVSGFLRRWSRLKSQNRGEEK